MLSVSVDQSTDNTIAIGISLKGSREITPGWNRAPGTMSRHEKQRHTLQ